MFGKQKLRIDNFRIAVTREEMVTSWFRSLAVEA